MMDGIQDNTTILWSPETQTEKLQSSLPAGFPKIFGRKQSTSKTVPRGALAIGLLRSSCLVGLCVCARLYLQLICKICGFSVAVPKSQALDRSSVGSGHLFPTSLQRANATSCLLSPLNQNGVGVHFVTGTRHSNSVLSSYCNHMCQLATCGVYTVDSEISLYGLHCPLEYDLLVRFKVKAATKTGLHLNYNL